MTTKIVAVFDDAQLKNMVRDFINANPGWAVMSHMDANVTLPAAATLHYDYHVKALTMHFVDRERVKQVANVL